MRLGRTANKMKSDQMVPRGLATAPPLVNAIVRSTGQTLDKKTREFMEPRFGHSFSRVRVHTDDRAAESARSMNALAYTVGHHIVFGKGQYAPEKNSGKRLLAHELAHVVQQGANGERTGSSLPVTSRGDAKERRADSAAQSVMEGRPVHLAPEGGLQIARQETTTPDNGTAEVPVEAEPSRRQMASDLLASVKESPLHAPEILGEVWESIKEHWIAFLGVLVAFLLVETVIALLAGAPEPTLLTKVVAGVLQALLIIVIGVFAVVEVVSAYSEGSNWLGQATQANGDPDKISEASRSLRGWCSTSCWPFWRSSVCGLRSRTSKSRKRPKSVRHDRRDSKSCQRRKRSKSAVSREARKFPPERSASTLRSRLCNKASTLQNSNSFISRTSQVAKSTPAWVKPKRQALPRHSLFKFSVTPISAILRINSPQGWAEA